MNKITTFVAKYAKLCEDLESVSQPLDLPPINNELLRQKELEFNKLDAALKSLREQSAQVKQKYKSEAYTHLQST